MFGCNVLGFASSNPPTMYSPIVSADGTQFLWQKLVQGKALIMGTGEIPVLKNTSCPPQAGFSAAPLGNARTFFSSLVFFKAKRALLLLLFLPKFGQHWTENWGKQITVHKYSVESYLFLFSWRSLQRQLQLCCSGQYWLTFRNLSSTWGYGWANRKKCSCICWPK